MMIQPTMFAVKSYWGEKPTFKLIPITKEAPFIECIFEPEHKWLVVLSTHKKEMFHMLPRLDQNGEPEKNKSTGQVKNQRVAQESYSEYYIYNIPEIEEFLRLVCINTKFDFMSFFKVEKEVIKGEPIPIKELKAKPKPKE